MVRRALGAIGGMERFVSAGDDVIVKPNICVAYHTYEYAATTNPWVVGGLVKLALEAGARRVRATSTRPPPIPGWWVGWSSWPWRPAPGASG
jgi:uncharacterized protein (DUF362 family)